MSDWRKTADKVTKLVALASSSNPHEAARAREHALRMVRDIDLELLETLAEQRSELREDCLTELRRLRARNARPNAGTRELVSRARLLLGHYEAIDALPAVVRLLREVDRGPLLSEDHSEIKIVPDASRSAWERRARG